MYSNTEEMLDGNNYRYVLYKADNACIKQYFSQDTVNLISKKVTQLLQGVEPENRPILVPDETIVSVMSTIYYNFRPTTGDIYGRYNIPSHEQQSYVQSMIDQVIEVITSQIRNEYGFIENNSKLTIWTTVYGDFNKFGLRQHPPLKINHRKPNTMEFNMNY